MSEFSPENERLIAAIKRERARLYAISDEDPALAIVEARRLRPGPELDEADINQIRASIFIDAGDRLSDAATVREGTELFRRSQKAGIPDAAYNVANGLASSARIDAGPGMQGLLKTAERRQEARSLFQQAAEKSSEPSVKSAAFTNQGNLLKDSHRWVEAYDAYAEALEHDSTNAVALSGVSNLLRWRFRSRVDAPVPLRRAAVRYVSRARVNIEQARVYAGLQGVRRVEKLIRELEIDLKLEEPQEETPPESPYLAFVRKYRLALCLAPESAGADSARWDHLTIKSINEPAKSDWRVPTIFATWNILKSDFLAARWLAHTALNGEIPETGLYADTLDDANYGVRYGALVLSQKAAIDVLDKIAVALTHYLNLPGNRKRIYFATRWHVMDARNGHKAAVPLQWQPEIEAEITSGNTDLFALSELGQDYATGPVHLKKEVRNSGTHRFVILHDILTEGHSRPSDVVERYSQQQFERTLLESLQIARAALLYFRGVISNRERRLRRLQTGITVPIEVPSHHSIGGRERGA